MQNIYTWAKPGRDGQYYHEYPANIFVSLVSLNTLGAGQSATVIEGALITDHVLEDLEHRELPSCTAVLDLPKELTGNKGEGRRRRERNGAARGEKQARSEERELERGEGSTSEKGVPS